MHIQRKSQSQSLQHGKHLADFKRGLGLFELANKTRPCTAEPGQNLLGDARGETSMANRDRDLREKRVIRAETYSSISWLSRSGR